MNIALQLFSIRHIAETDGMIGMLDKTKELGFDGVEFAGLYDLSPEKAKEELDKRGLKCAGFHDRMDNLMNPDVVDAAIDACKKCGAESMCMPYYKVETIAEWKEFALRLEEVGKRFVQNGIRFGYHNHIHEFQPIDGVLPIDVVLENTTPENVYFEMDTRHIVLAGVKPEEYIKKYADRVHFLHARDTNGTRDIAAGSGLVDFPAVLNVIKRPKWFVVEFEDENKAIVEKEVADSVVYLRNTFGE